ncbi:HBL/NHE enterotoxin family protein [Streptomyces roseoverticillatus]|uniref:HBL/NHE enterotoxin family protein n=1 Tax=Streptomyces roseoverticillatus TaxID=66429 RepID=UPI001F47812D|nr:HBL/NHE enterotoxin family protein [Streptomyces roseoverticillatus]MCF3106961.1 HBL/NHE enterotoxin family protein [Streptomyces roseoverticillatus]
MTMATPAHRQAPGDAGTVDTSAPEAVFASCQVLVAAATGITAQPDLSLDLVPDLRASQALARSHAGLWSSRYQEALLQPLADITGYANACTSYLPDLLTLAGRIAARDEEAVPEFREGLSELKQALSSLQGHTDASKDQISRFRDRIEDDRVRFGAHARTLAEKYTGDHGEIAAIRNNLSVLDSRLQNTNAAIALGAAKGIPGALVTGIQLALAAEDVFGTAKAVIQAGLSLARSTAHWDAEAMSDNAMKLFDEARKVPGVYKAVKTAVDQPALFQGISQSLDEAQAAMDSATVDIAEYGRQLAKLTDDELQVGVFVMLQGQVERLALRTGDALTALDAVAEVWHREEQRLARLDALAQDMSAALADELTEAAAHWILNAQAAQRFQDTLVDLRPPQG